MSVQGNDLMAQWWAQNCRTPAGPPANEVWYRADAQVTLYSNTGVTGHTFADGKGIIEYSSGLTMMPNTLRNTEIEKVDFPSTVLGIEAGAFYGCTQLADVDLSNITSFGNAVFRGCANIGHVELNTAVRDIPQEMFYGCARLEMDSLPPNLTTIGANALRQCAKLAFRKLPDSVASIGNIAFRDDTSLALEELPKSLTAINTQVFFWMH